MAAGHNPTFDLPLDTNDWPDYTQDRLRALVGADVHVARVPLALTSPTEPGDPPCVQPTRRGFLVGCSTAIASLAGSRFNSFAFAQAARGGGTNDEILVVLFLRGGQDGLNLVVPTGGASNDRAVLRAGAAQPARADRRTPAQRCRSARSAARSFGLHPAAAPLHELFQDGKLSVVTACGMAANERSHFDSMNWMELGTPGVSNITNGWLTRHLAVGDQPAVRDRHAVARGRRHSSRISLLAQLRHDQPRRASIPSRCRPAPGPGASAAAHRRCATSTPADSSWLHQTGLQALDAVDIVELYASGGYTPANGAVYPHTWFGENLQTIAQMIKLDLGLRVATLDLGGWDTHENQGNAGGGMYAGLVDELAQGLAAL